MLPLVGKYNAVYVAMHMQGVPSNMQENPSYKKIIPELISFFSDK